MTTTQSIEKAVVDRIRSIQKGRGTTDIHLFTAAGISRTTWRASMCGNRSFTIRELIAISSALGVRLSDLTSDSLLSHSQAA